MTISGESSEEFESTTDVWLGYATVVLFLDLLGVFRHRSAIFAVDKVDTLVIDGLILASVPPILLQVFFGVLIARRIFLNSNLLQRSFFAFQLVHAMFLITVFLTNIDRMGVVMFVCYVASTIFGPIFMAVYFVGNKAKALADSNASE